MSQETWVRPEKIAAAMQRFAGRMRGWQAPAAFGVVLVPQSRLGTSAVHFSVVNVPVHGLPAMVMGLLTGRRSESETWDLSPSELDWTIAFAGSRRGGAHVQPTESHLRAAGPNTLICRERAIARGASCRRDISPRCVGLEPPVGAIGWCYDDARLVRLP